MAEREWTKGHVVIQKFTRDAPGIKPGWFATQWLVDGRVEVQVVPPEHNDVTSGVLATQIDVRIPVGDSR